MKILTILDPLPALNVKKDTTIALMQAIEDLGHEVWTATASDLSIAGADAFAMATQIHLDLDNTPYYKIANRLSINLSEFNIILMRKDPPFDMNYIFTTYVLDIAAQNGVLVANNPQALRDFNEKLLLNRFPHLTKAFIASSSVSTLEEFITTHQDVVVKPLDSMGGDSIYRLKSGTDHSEILLTMTIQETKMILAMDYIPEVTIGDKRILILNGQPVDHALLRIPPEGQLQANLAAGGTGKVVPLSDNDRRLCAEVAPFCLEHGLYFVGMDVIGDYITEINITSPTCLREIAAYTKVDLAKQFIEGLLQHGDAQH